MPKALPIPCDTGLTWTQQDSGHFEAGLEGVHEFRVALDARRAAPFLCDSLVWL